MVNIRLRYMTLIELMISMTLTAVVLTTLTYFYQQVNSINAEMDRAQNESFQKRYVENRLGEVLTRVVSSTDPSNDFHFFSSPDLGGLFMEGSTSLVFTFDNCVRLNKEMAYHVIGRLYLDKEGRLVLATWPTEKRWKENTQPPMHREILLENVETLDFEFFVPPDKGKTFIKKGDEKKTKEQKALLPLDIREDWPKQWKKEYRQLPAIVRATITRKFDEKEETLIFAYPLPNTLQPITYD